LLFEKKKTWIESLFQRLKTEKIAMVGPIYEELNQHEQLVVRKLLEQTKKKM